MPDRTTTTLYEQEYSNYAVIAQVTQPNCVPLPPACTLAISGYTATDVTVRGDNDGSIIMGISGYIGTTANVIYSINGVNTFTGGTVHTFTGLSAGYYNLLVRQVNCFDQVVNIQILDGEFRTGDFVVVSPTGLTATENPIILSLSTARNPGYSQVGMSTLSVTGTINDGNKIIFSLEYPQSYTAEFTAKNFPNRDDYFLASVLKDGSGVVCGSNTATEIATSIGEALSNDTVIPRLYNIRASGTYVYLTAKEANAKLNVTTGSTITLTGNISCTETQIGNSEFDGQITQNYSLYTDIFVNQDAEYGTSPDISTFTRVSQIELPFKSNNQHYFDVSNVLKNFVSTPKIDFSATGATTFADMMCAYVLQYGEKYPLVPNSTTKKSRVKGITNTQFCINSSLDWTDINSMDNHLGSNATNLNPNFTLQFNWSTYTGYIVFQNVLLDIGNTNTTSIGYSVWDSGNTTIYKAWQTGGTITDITGGIYYARISGITSGTMFMYSRSFYQNEYYEGIDTTVYPIPKGHLKFLTNQPSPKQVQRDSSEYLYIILPRDYGTPLKVIGDLYFYDGSSLMDETLYDITTGTTNWGGVIALAAGYNELNLASYEVLTGNSTRKIRRVDFAIYQEIGTMDIPLTETLSYRYEIDELPRRFGVAFMNTHGCWSIFDFSGEIIDSVAFSNNIYEVPRQVGLYGNSPLGFESKTVYGTKVIKKYACNTGWIDLNHFNWLIELLSSNRIYNYTDDNQQFLTVETVNYTKSSNDDLFNIDVVFNTTLQVNNVSV